MVSIAEVLLEMKLQGAMNISKISIHSNFLFFYCQHDHHYHEYYHCDNHYLFHF